MFIKKMDNSLSREYISSAVRREHPPRVTESLFLCVIRQQIRLYLSRTNRRICTVFRLQKLAQTEEILHGKSDFHPCCNYLQLLSVEIVKCFSVSLITRLSRYTKVGCNETQPAATIHTGCMSHFVGSLYSSSCSCFYFSHIAERTRPLVKLVPRQLAKIRYPTSLPTLHQTKSKLMISTNIHP